MPWINPETGEVWDEQKQAFVPDPVALGPAESAIEGGMRTVERLEEGAKDLYDLASFNPQAREVRRGEQSTREQEYKRQTSQHPYMALAGETVPYMVAPVGSTPLRAGAIGGLLGASTYQPEQSPAGLLGGFAGGALGQRLTQNIGRHIGGPLENRARDLGFRLTPGQRTDSHALQQLEAGLKALPITSQPFTSAYRRNQAVMNRQAAQSLGEQADALTPDVLDSARRRIGGVYDELSDIDIQADDQLVNDLIRIQDEYGDTIMREGALDADVNRALSAVRGGDQISGNEYQNIASKIRRKAENQMTSAQGDREYGLALYEIKEALDDTASRSMTEAQRQAFEQARGQWRNLMMLTGTGTKVVNESGDVSGKQLANVLRRKDKLGYVFGRNQGDLYDLARVSQHIKDVVGDSGTATRSSFLDLMTGGGVGAGIVTDPAKTAGVLAGANLAARGYMNLPSLLPNVIRSSGIPAFIAAENPLKGLLSNGD